ncbi:MAG: hypothetical protein LBS20_10810 [Prevotella sp.]|jgi:hypothetical protein|nr:hypothetical protein [Prevotella sp.]
MGTKKQQGSVKVVNALATIHKILDEMAPSGTLDYIVESKKNETLYVFIANGICATLHVQVFNPVQEGGKR